MSHSPEKWAEIDAAMKAVLRETRARIRDKKHRRTP